MTKFNFRTFASIILIGLFLVSCTATGKKKSSKPFKHNEPLIKTDVKKLGKKELDKMSEIVHVPDDAEVVKLKKRKKIYTVKEKNYMLIPDEYKSLKQNITFNFQNMDYAEAMRLMAKIGGVNILVSEDVAGSITAQLNNVPWDKAFNA